MISPHIDAVTLEGFYAKLRAAQWEAHGREYTLHHREIERCAEECESYLELGVNQGTTLACALLAGYKSVSGVDLTFVNWAPYENLFAEYARYHDAELHLYRQDSRLWIGSVDFLLIDSYHTPGHLIEELRVHGRSVRKYILIHDTMLIPALHDVATRWASMHEREGWRIMHREARNVGFTLLQRIPTTTDEHTR